MPAIIVYKDGQGWTKDQNFYDWCSIFKAGLREYLNIQTFVAGPPLYLQTNTVNGCIAAIDEYFSTFNTLKDPRHATHEDVEDKDEAKRIAIDLIRGVCRIIDGNGGLTAKQRADLGLNPLTTARTPVQNPETPPSLEYENGPEGSVIFKYHDMARGESDRRKPRGMLYCFIRSVVTGPVGQPASMVTNGYGDNIIETFAERTPTTVVFPHRFIGMAASSTAKWVGKSKTESGWSKLIEYVVPS